MKPIVGLHTDTAANDQPSNTYRFAKNIVLTKLNQAVANEPGNTQVNSVSGYTLLYSIPVRDGSSVRFLVQDTYLSNPSTYLCRIDIMNKLGVATLLVSHHDLLFTRESTFKGVHYYSNDDDLIIAWTDGVNPIRIHNVTSPGFVGTTPDAKYIVRMNLFPNSVAPSMEAQFTNQEIGSIRNGAYVFYVTYETDVYSTTNFFSGSGPFLVGAGEDFDGLSSEAIKLNVVGLDVNYDYYRLYAVRMENGAKTGYYLSRRLIPAGGVDAVIWGGGTLGITSVEDIVVDSISYDSAKTMTVVNNRLYLGALTSDAFMDYQPYANAITAKWTYHQNRPDTNRISSKGNSEVYGNWRGFMPGASYAFYIAFTLKDGTYSPAFHIPGRKPVSDTVFEGIGNGTGLRRCDVNDYSDYDGVNVADISPYTGVSVPYWFGDMSYTRNESEYYPDDSSWDTKNPSGAVVSGASLRNSRVRHHKFPSLQALPVHTSGLIDTDDWNILFGVQFQNIPIPTGLQEMANGYTIFYASRDFGDMDVVAYIPVLSWNFQDTANYNPNGNYIVPCVSSGVCYEYRVNNSDFVTPAVISYSDCSGTSQTDTIIADDYIIVFASTVPTTVSGIVTLTLINTNPAQLCEYAKIPSSKLRIYDPTLLSKKPQISSAFVIPEWYNGDSYIRHTLVTETLTTQEALASRVGEIQYAPANSISLSNKEREEAAYLGVAGIIAGPYLGRGEEFYRGVRDHIGKEIIIGSLRQRIPNIYFGYGNRSLVSTSHTMSILSLGSNPYATVSGTGYYLRSTSIMGGDISIEEIKVKYMSSEDNGDTSLYTPPSNGATVNWLGYIYYVNNAVCKTVRDFTYTAPSRLPATKMYEDKGLAPVLNSAAITYYTGEYLNQYLLNTAYEVVNTFKPAFSFNDVVADFQTKFPTRIARSIVQQSENPNLSWRVFRALDYYEHVKTKGEITNIEEFSNELIIHHKYSMFKTIGKEKFDTDSTSIYLGSGDIFTLPPVEVIDTPGGYAGTGNMFSTLLSKLGYFFVDESQGKVFLVSGELNEISAKGRRNWFKTNLPFTLRTQLAILGISDKFNLWDSPVSKYGVGFNSAYDEEFNRIILGKVEWYFANLSDVANSSAYNSIAVGPIYFIGGIPGTYTYVIGGEFPVFTPMNMSDPRIISNRWTTSYSPGTDSWISLHSYQPDYMWGTRDSWFTAVSGITYKQQIGSPGMFMGVLYPSILDVVFNMSPGVTKTFSSFTWVTETLNVSGGSVKKDTFTHATVYNSYQLSNKITLTDMTNIRESEGTWGWNGFRDLLTTQNADIIDEKGVINYATLNVSMPWYLQRRFTDKYAILRLEYSNATTNTLYLYDVSSSARMSYR